MVQVTMLLDTILVGPLRPHSRLVARAPLDPIPSPCLSNHQLCRLHSVVSASSSSSRSGGHSQQRGKPPCNGRFSKLNVPGRVAITAFSAANGSPHKSDSTAKVPPQSPTVQLVHQPLSPLDVDIELWEVLDLCSDEELETLYNILHSTSPFSPLIKSLVAESEPALLQLRGRASIMHKLESRFRFLAADSQKTLLGQRPGYRQTLLDIRDRLGIPCSSNLCTYDLETEVFLYILNNCLEYVQGETDSDPSIAAAVASADESQSVTFDCLPSKQVCTDVPVLRSAPKARTTSWTERLTAPLRFGLKELAPTLLNVGAVTTASAVGKQTMQRLGTHLFCSHLQYQAAVRAAGSAIAGVGKEALIEAAQRGLTSATARYSVFKGALSCLGPLMWGWLAVDLTMKAMGTDYARVIRAVFLLAQVRLTRTGGFVSPARFQEPDEYQDPGAAFL